MLNVKNFHGSKIIMMSALSIIALGSLAYFIINTRDSKSEHERSLKKVTIAQFGDVFLYAPLYIAKDSGIFKSHGLDVSFVSTGGDEKTWAAVVSGNAIAGVADPTFVAISAERGLPGVVISSIISKAPFWGITFKDTVPKIANPAQLKGLSVATFPSPSTAYTLQKRMFQLGNINPNIKQGAFGSLIAMLKAGQADIALEIEPTVSQTEASGSRVVYGLDKVYGDFLTTGVTVEPSSLKTNPTVLKSIVCSLYDSMIYIRSHPEAVIKMMTKRFPEVNPEVAREAISRMTKSGVIPSSTLISEEAWSKAIKLRKDVGDLKSGGEFNVFVDNRFTNSCNTNASVEKSIL